MRNETDRRSHHHMHHSPPTSRGSLSFLVVSVAALIWLLVRLVPKPSRASYPCMRVAMSLSSTLLLPISAFGLSILSMTRARRLFMNSRPWLAASLMFAAVLLPDLLPGDARTAEPVYPTLQQVPNVPIGRAQGIFPGRVVWVHDSAATNANCSPSAYGHGWFLAENSNQTEIDRMLSEGLQSLTGQPTDSAAWRAVFLFHNHAVGKGSVGYQTGEKIFIKINATSAWAGNINPSDLSKVQNSYYGISETSPQVVLSVLRQLVHVVGVPDSDIYVGDPMKHIYKHCYDLWHPEFPNAHYLDHDGWNHREKVVHSTTGVVYYSDRGTVLHTSTAATTWHDTLYSVFDSAAYLINIPMLKGHMRAGMTAFAKNHFGSNIRDDASHLHDGLVSPDQVNVTRPGYGLYRVQVDLLGHRLLGRKNLVYIMDALWATDYELDQPVKWNMPPFNGDWMSSMFFSLDPVAIESVGYDFLRSEFTAQRGLGTYVQMNGVDDYLHQAADSTNWPAGITYDPDSTGTPLASLGTHEHWDNATDMKYSRNLGTGNGIELIRIPATTTAVAPHTVPGASFVLSACYPNPFNPSTTIAFTMPHSDRIRLAVYDILGNRVRTLIEGDVPAGERSILWDGKNDRGNVVGSGVYFYTLTSGSGLMATKKMVLMK